MPTEPVAAATSDGATGPYRAWLARWPLILGFVALAGPTFASLGEQVWTRESGAHGPIVLATAAWLLARGAGSFSRLATPASPWVIAAGLSASLALYVFGRAFDFISLEAAGLYGVGLTIIYSVVGARAILANWFPLFYLAFIIPPPNWLMDELTGPLKQFVSYAATKALEVVGLPIAREGVTIHVAQYQLLVEDACSGMNSLVGLSAISLLYIYLLRGSSLRYSLVLTLFVIPIAVIGNILRVMTLILLTYFFGDQVAQGFAHFAAGIFLFTVDLILVYIVDELLSRSLPARWRPAR